jgi:hypothetical protein
MAGEVKGDYEGLGVQVARRIKLALSFSIFTIV